MNGVKMNYSLNFENKKPNYSLVLDQNVLDKYYEYYFNIHKKATKKPIDRPIHPSINVWSILPRIQMNALKQKWKDFIIWWINDIGLNDLKLDKFGLVVKVYMPSKRRADADNMSIKFIADGFTESGLIIDDDGKHLNPLVLIPDYDKDNPRTEFYFYVYEE